MPRKSSNDHLKPEVLSLFAEGKTLVEVEKIYPGIPRGTLYRWHDNWKKENTGRIRANTGNPVNTGSCVSELRPKLTVLPAPTDGVDWVLLQAKDIIEKNKQRDPRVAIAAINSYLKALEVAAKISDPDLDEEIRESLRLLSDDELKALGDGRVPPNPSPVFLKVLSHSRRRL